MSAQIVESASVVKVSGELNFSTVMRVWQETLSLVQQRNDLHFDFTQVGACDSAGLALILEWVKYAKTHNKSIRFSHFPEQLGSIITMSGMQDILKPYFI